MYQKFTFHYGYILIELTDTDETVDISFTFHYGYILIQKLSAYPDYVQNLHSTMVIF